MFILTQRKRCSACGEKKYKSEFNKNKHNKDGIHHECKACKAKRAHEYRSTHVYDERDRQKKWRLANPERRREQDRRYLSAHLEEERERKRMWALNNPEKERESSHRRNLKWRLTHPEKERNRHQKRLKEHPEKNREYSRNRRALKKGVGGKITAREWNGLCEKYGNKCLCCGRNDVFLTMDHIVPIVLGGTHTVDNVQPLCQTCNGRKFIKVIDYR
jgi:hypothetical protein